MGATQTPAPPLPPQLFAGALEGMALAGGGGGGPGRPPPTVTIVDKTCRSWMIRNFSQAFSASSIHG